MLDNGTIAGRIKEARSKDLAQTFTYNGWVVRKYRCVCMTVPKVACTTVKLTLHQLARNSVPDPANAVHRGDIGLILKDYPVDDVVDMLTSKDWIRFCFVRNPYDRLFSAYKSKIGNTRDMQFEWLRNDIREKNDYPIGEQGRSGIVTFHDFVHYLAEVGAEVHYNLDPKRDHDSHFNVQSRILKKELIAYDFIGRYERIGSDFREILTSLGAPDEALALASQVWNSTTQISLPWVYSRELADLAYEMYHEDFDTFGYDRDSWMRGESEASA